MSERALARHLVACSLSGKEPAFGGSDPKHWVIALEQLISWNALDAAVFAAPRLREAFPTLSYFRRMALVLERLPPACPGRPDLVVEPDREVQLARMPGASAVIFAFTGRFGSLGLPLQLLHRWFVSLDAHIVYLRDALDNAFVCGIPSMASGYGDTVSALQACARDLGATRISCYGNSTGGYAALRYALDLPAARVLAFGAPTSLAEEAWRERVAGRRPFAAGPDLRPLYAAAAAPPKVRLVFGADNAIDAEHARNLDGLPGVTVEPVPGWSGHNAFLDLIARGRFVDVLGELNAPRTGRSETADRV